MIFSVICTGIFHWNVVITSTVIHGLICLVNEYVYDQLKSVGNEVSWALSIPITETTWNHTICFYWLNQCIYMIKIANADVQEPFVLT